jgi:hypothetical protein
LLKIMLFVIQPPAPNVMITTENTFQYSFLTFLLPSILLTRALFFKCLFWKWFETRTSFGRVPSLFLVFQLYVWQWEVCNLPVAFEMLQQDQLVVKLVQVGCSVGSAISTESVNAWFELSLPLNSSWELSIFST